MNFEKCLAFTLKAEGGWSDNPNDPGGATNHGITLATYQQWKNDPTITPEQLQEITDEEVAAIYRQNYWNPVAGGNLPSGVDIMVFDMAVNSGVHASARILQSCLNVVTDGDIGPETIHATQTATPSSLINALAEAQASYYQGLSDFPTFGKGWLNRASARKQMALGMIF